jgi:dUTPase
MVIAPVTQVKISKVDQLSLTKRGDKGFGSTGQ